MGSRYRRRMRRIRRRTFRGNRLEKRLDDIFYGRIMLWCSMPDGHTVMQDMARRAAQQLPLAQIQMHWDNGSIKLAKSLTNGCISVYDPSKGKRASTLFVLGNVIDSDMICHGRTAFGWLAQPDGMRSSPPFKGPSWRMRQRLVERLGRTWKRAKYTRKSKGGSRPDATV